MRAHTVQMHKSGTRLFLALVLLTFFTGIGSTPTQAAPTTHSDDIYVALSNGAQFVGTGVRWHDNFCRGAEICKLGDVNGDGRDDAIAFVRTNNAPDDSDVYVALSNGTRFGPPVRWHDYFCTLEEICEVADVNGDGRDDILAFVRTNNGVNDSNVYVALSNGTSFGPGQIWHDYFCTLEEICAVGDANGDGKADILAFVRTNNSVNDSNVYVALSDGTQFGPGQIWHDYFCTLEEICAVGDVNGDGKADIVTFVRTNHGINDSDVYVAFSNGTQFGPGQKWHDYFCTLDEVCAVGDVDGNGKDDVAAFVRAHNANPFTAHTIDVTISLYRTRSTEGDREPYEAIIRHFADGIFEMTNGAHRVGKVTFYQNGAMKNSANVVWVDKNWPSASTAGYWYSGQNIRTSDVYSFTTNLYDSLASGNERGGGYTLAHEYGHYYYGLYDEYQGTAKCDDPNAFTDPQTCDVAVQNSVMSDQWQAVNIDKLAWLNFSVPIDQTARNANKRVYGASGWEVLARHPLFDPRDGQRNNLRPRPYWPDLQNAAPVGNARPTIELPNSASRAALSIVWVAPSAAAPSPGATTTGDYFPRVMAMNGSAVLYPEAGVLTASLDRDGELITAAEVSAAVTYPDASSADLFFRDDGVSPDGLASDGLYAALLPYNQDGLYLVTVNFSNNAGLAEITYANRHFTPGPNGETYDPPPHPVGENFAEQASVEIMVSGFPEDPSIPAAPIQMTVDNRDFPGRIDVPGDKDTFTFTAEQGGELVLRITDLALGMQPHVLVYQEDSQVPFREVSFDPQGERYLFIKLDVQAGDHFTVEVKHNSADAAEGLYNISVGPGLANTLETFLPSLYLPALQR